MVEDKKKLVNIVNKNIIHHVYAILNDYGVIKDIRYAATKADADTIASTSFVYGKSFCIDKYPVQINDFYLNKKFYHTDENGNHIEIVPYTEEEDRISDLELIIEQKNETIKYLEQKLSESSV